MPKYEINCANCAHGIKRGLWLHCTKGKGTFPKNTRFQKCNKYISRKEYDEQVKKESANQKLARMIKSGVK